MADNVNLRHLDVRIIDKNLERGLLSREQVDAWLASLPDDAANAVATDTRMVRVHPRPFESVDETVA